MRNKNNQSLTFSHKVITSFLVRNYFYTVRYMTHLHVTLCSQPFALNLVMHIQFNYVPFD